MSNVSMSDAELLKFAIENGMLDTALVREEIEMQKREEILKKHPYSIWEDKNGTWHTYLPGENKGRIPKKRKTKKGIEELIIQYWEEQDETVHSLFCEWVTAKLDRGEISKATKDRYFRQFEQCFSELGERKINLISEYDVEEFILNTIHSCKLTPKGFSNFRTLVYGIFRLAKRKKLISYSISQILDDMEISRKSFRKVERNDDEQVFMLDEIPRVVNYLEENPDIINLGILLMFKTGMRVGELSSIKITDVNDLTISIHRTEVSYEEDGSRIYVVRDFPKTDAGIRVVVIPDNYAWVIKKIRLLNPFGEYLFERNGERVRTYVFRNRLYTVCKKTETKMKSPHKVRKTYGSFLIDSGVPESTVIKQMGHTDIKTTKEYYYKNRRNTDQIREELNKAESVAN